MWLVGRLLACCRKAFGECGGDDGQPLRVGLGGVDECSVPVGPAALVRGGFECEELADLLGVCCGDSLEPGEQRQSRGVGGRNVLRGASLDVSQSVRAWVAARRCRRSSAAGSTSLPGVGAGERAVAGETRRQSKLVNDVRPGRRGLGLLDDRQATSVGVLTDHGEYPVGFVVEGADDARRCREAGLAGRSYL